MQIVRKIRFCKLYKIKVFRICTVPCRSIRSKVFEVGFGEKLFSKSFSPIIQFFNNERAFC